MTTAWMCLVIAGVAEWGWPVELKVGWTPQGGRRGWMAFSIACMLVSGLLLLYAQTVIAMATACGAWTGVAAVGAFVLGVYLFKEPATLARFSFLELIVIGILSSKLVSA
jgi:quaternary ammonium compound-resistance protein SugE